MIKSACSLDYATIRCQNPEDQNLNNIPENGATTYIRNVGIPQELTVLQPRRPWAEQQLLRWRQRIFFRHGVTAHKTEISIITGLADLKTQDIPSSVIQRPFKSAFLC
jgi:hypothetical protein